MALVYQDGFARPPDVPAYVPVPISFAAAGQTSRIGDGTGTRGSPMPLIAAQLDDIRSYAPGWLVADSAPPVIDGVNNEPKFRAHANVTHILPDDPIRAYGQPGASHLHTFFGNFRTNAFSTYESLRNRANEAARLGIPATATSGGPYNASGYWMPAMVSGDSVVKPGMIFIYYTGNSAANTMQMQRIPRGLRYVFGFNMDDPDDQILHDQVAAANAMPGNGGRYVYAGNGFEGWAMCDEDLNTIQTIDGHDFSPHFINLDGSCPWDIDDDAPYYLKAKLDAPVGIDGTNLWSPGGMKHVHPGIRDSSLGSAPIVLPEGYYAIPQLQIVPFFRLNGWNDLQNWELSSDAHGSMVAGRTLAPGTTFHADWFGAWDDSVMGDATGWMHDCVSCVDGATMHECASGCVRADGTRLLGSIGGDNAPDGSRMPQLGLPEVYDTNNPGDMFAIPSFTGPVTVPALTA